MQSGWKVGVLVVAFGALLYFGFSLVGNSLNRKPVDRYLASFENASGITAGTMVSMAGVGVGKVSRVTLVSPTEARMDLEIHQGTFVPKDAKLQVPTSLFSLGDSRVEIISERGLSAGKLPPGSTIPGVRGSMLKGVLPEGEATIAELNATLKATRELLEDAGLRVRLKAVLDSTNNAVKALDGVAKNVNTLIARNQNTIATALANAAGAVEDLRSGIRSVTANLSGEDIAASVKSMLASLNSTAKRAEELVAQINEFVGDPALRTAMSNTVANMEAMSRSGVDIAENTKAMTADGKVVSAKAIELADDAKEIAEQARDLLAKLNELVGRLPGTTKLSQPTVQLETGRNFDTNRFQTDAFIRYPVKDNAAIVVGVNDATEANKLTAQYAQILGNQTLRYGVYASKPGVGVDWLLAPRFSLSGDLFDPNDLTLNLRARYYFGSEAFGFLGVDRVFDRNQAILGVGIRR